MNQTDMKFGKVAVLMGGFSAERAVSLSSGEAVLQGLLEAGINAVGIDVDHNIAKILLDGNFDCAFNILHGRGGEDGSIQGLLEWMEIPYTGANIMSSAIGMDKLKTKQIWQTLDFPTAPYAILHADMDFAQTIADLGGKAMVKPVQEGSSVGMSIADDAASLKQAYQLASEKDDTVIAEQWIEGAEYTVGILNEIALPVIRCETDSAFYDYEAKYESDETRYLIPCGLSESAEQAMQDLAKKSFSAIGCTGWGRVDVMVDGAGKSWLLEVNTVPGMTSHSLVPKAAAAVGISFSDLVVKILQGACLHNIYPSKHNKDKYV